MNTDGQSLGPPGSPVLDQGFDKDSLYSLRAAVSAHAAAAGLGKQRVYDVVAATHELAANAVRHGAGRGRLLLWTKDGSLYCQVSDDGPATPRDASASQDGSARWRTSHGHGLWVVGQVADQVNVDRGPDGTIATVVFAISSTLLCYSRSLLLAITVTRGPGRPR